MESTRPSTKRRFQKRKKVRWNYKRIAFALVALIAVLTVTAYSGYNFMKSLTASAIEKTGESVSNTDIKVEPPDRKSPITTTTTTVTPAENKPAYTEYTVEEGDTYYGIAKEYNTTVDKIKEANGVDPDDNNLQIGTVLKIPSKESIKNSAGDSREDTPTAPSQATNIKVSSEEISRGPEDLKKVAFTFDAGASSEATPKILQGLEEAGIIATFFLTGKWVEENPKLTNKIASQGHLIGNHTYSHPDLTKEKDEDITYQLKKCEEKIKSLTGLSTKPLFRPPYGARDRRVLRVAAENGYRSIYWTIDSLDWKTSMSSSQVKNRILAGLGNGAIILMHCGSPQTAEVLPDLIDEIESRGYEIVSAPELFNDN